MGIKQGKAFSELLEIITKQIQNGETTIDLTDLKKIMNDLSYEHYLKRLNGEEVAEELSNFVNSSMNDQNKEFVEAVTSDHRTLQQSMFKLFYNCMETWAEYSKMRRFDDRNKATCEMSEKMIEATKEDYIPYI